MEGGSFLSVFVVSFRHDAAPKIEMMARQRSGILFMVHAPQWRFLYQANAQFRTTSGIGQIEIFREDGSPETVSKLSGEHCIFTA